MITGPLSKAAAKELEELWDRLDEDDPWDYFSHEAIAELEMRSLKVCGLFCKFLRYIGTDQTYALFEECLYEDCADMQFTPKEKSLYYEDWLTNLAWLQERLMERLAKAQGHGQPSLDWYRVTMLEVAEQMRNIKLERIAADKAKELGIDTDSKAYSSLLKIMRIDLNSHVSVTKQSVRDSVYGSLGRTGKAYLEKWKVSQKQ